jgi:DNA primase large subunit
VKDKDTKMQSAFSKFAKNDYAKYPFLKEAAKYLKIPDLRIEDLTNPELEEILKRAEERLEEAILYTIVSRSPQSREDIEIMSFPVAVMLAVATKDSFIKKRYALAEANQTYESLKEEPDGKILEFAQNFGWKLALNTTLNLSYTFSLHFADYLRNTTHLRDREWKLVNRILSNGNVYLGKEETVRLLKEEVRKYIENKLEVKELPNFPPKIMEIAEKIKNLSIEKIGKTEMEGFPKTVVQTAFPPCINALYEAITSGRHLSHVGRFTLTSFLVSIGMPTENVIELFRNFSDYSERMTRYQVEHIAGEKGSRTRYTPPRCDTLQTHGVCTNPDEICQKIRHPLVYYRRKSVRS